MTSHHLKSTLEKLTLDDISNNRIINSLPGLFFIYEKINDRFELILWNKNHETITGYSSNELLKMSPFDFFYKTDHETIISGLKKIFHSGMVKQIFGNFKLKNGKTIPYIFEGYQFNKEDRSFFMGTGIDISSHIEEQKKLDRLKYEYSVKEREILAMMIDKDKEYIFINETTKELDEIIKNTSLQQIKKDLELLKIKLLQNRVSNDQWEVFRNRFTNINPLFFKNLNSKYPGLTKNDLKYCAYLKINLSNSQISSILNISKEGIKKRRYRLRKKLNLPNNISLENFIDSL